MSRCSSADGVKSGAINDKQRYQCQACRYLYTVSHKSDTSTAAQRRMAVTLHLEGLGVRSIGRILGLSHVAIYQWIKALGENVAQLKRSAAHIVDMDERHSDVGQKNSYWIWIAVDRLGKRLLHAVTGTRGVVRGEQLWAAITSPLIDHVMTDSWEPYEHFVLAVKHTFSPRRKPSRWKARIVFFDIFWHAYAGTQSVIARADHVEVFRSSS